TLSGGPGRRTATPPHEGLPERQPRPTERRPSSRTWRAMAESVAAGPSPEGTARNCGRPAPRPRIRRWPVSRAGYRARRCSWFSQAPEVRKTNESGEFLFGVFRGSAVRLILIARLPPAKGDFHRQGRQRRGRDRGKQVRRLAQVGQLGTQALKPIE